MLIGVHLQLPSRPSKEWYSTALEKRLMCGEVTVIKRVG